MRRIMFTALLGSSTFFAWCQDGAAKKSEALARAIADKVIASATFRFMNSNSGETFPATKGLAVSKDVKAESLYNTWQYANGVIDIGMLELSKTLSEPKYTDYVKRNYKFIFDNISYFESVQKEGKSQWYNKVFFLMNSLDACGALSAGLVENNAVDPRADYKAYLSKSIDYISNKQVRLPDGTFCRPEPREMTVWGDDLYMSVPFLARMGKVNTEKKYFDDAIKQVLNFNKYLYDSMTGLYYHAYFNDVKRNGVAHWGRCNGWIATAQVELLNHLPANHPKRKQLIDLLLRQIIGFSRYQDVSGLWHQVLDKPDSYLETSVTCMFTYAVARAVNEGWIDKSYISIAQNAWKGLSTKIHADGQIDDVCIGTGIENDIAFYYNRPKELNDFHVTGAALLAASEMTKYYRNNTK